MSDDIIDQLETLEQKPKRHRRTKEQMIADGDLDPSGVKVRGSSAKRSISVLVSGINDVLCAIPFTSSDALSEDEGAKLVEALDQAQQSNAKIRRFITKSTTGAGILPLVFVGFSILIPRLMNHGFLPRPKLTPEQEETYRQAMERMQAQQQGYDAAQAPNLYMGTGGATVTNGVPINA